MGTTDDPNEVFDLVDEHDNVIGAAPRSRCNASPNLIHRAAFVLVFNRRGEMLWQRRSMSKDTEPGAWTVSASGHVNAGESYETAAVRELDEELGIEGAPVALLGKYLLRYETENEWTAVYRTESEGPFRYPLGEVSEVRFLTVEGALEEEAEGLMKLAAAVHRILETGCLAV